MLDLSTKVKRYFDVKIETTTLKLEPPKIKTIKKLMGVAGKLVKDAGEADEEQLEELTEVVALILSKNKSGKKIDTDFVYEHMDYEDMMLLLSGYFEWVGEIQNDPN